ncbi:EAL domain-containing protein [Thioalkalivibrio sp. ALE23]|uniref:bifunctional diguanylate cyclase/phosphodiesterase n=1 Tax=Thioalkalivibrio sp. ALE23 TaxID=1265495 RepID=UPI000362F995|nr:EAL domain-containing protein [Thioalkalivibrio sp. ALE23]
MTLDRRIIWLLAAAAWVLVLLFLYLNWQDKAGMHEQRQTATLDTAYQAAVNSFDLAAQAYFREAVNRTEVVELLRAGQQAEDEAERARLRGRLYRTLWPTYDRLREGELRQLHFHTAEGISFLRFFSPEYLGDDLYATRPLIREVHRTREPAAGFETGRSLSGFRYVYPLHDGDEFVGSVEFSIPFRYVREMMNELDETREFQLILRRDAVEDKVPPGFLSLHETSCLHPDYVLEDTSLVFPDSPRPPSEEIRVISQQLADDPGTAEAIDAGARGVLSVELEGATWAANLLPITDPAGDRVAYVVAYTPDPLTGVFRREFAAAALGATLLIGLALLLLLRLVTSRERLRNQRAYQQAITNTMAEGLYAQDEAGRITFINPAASEILGYRPEDLLGKDAHTRFHRHAGNLYPDERDCPIRQRVTTGQVFEGEEAFRHQDGRPIPVEVSSRPLYQEGVRTGAVTLFRDISEHKRARERQKLAASVFTSANEAIIITDPQSRILMVNEAFTRLTGYTPEEVEGHNPSILGSGRQDAAFYRRMWQDLRENDYWHGELWNRRKNGELYLQLGTISAVRDEHGELLHYVGLFSDITERREYQERLEFLAHYDPLTELPNRVLLLDRLRQAMQLATRESRRVCVAYLDLDDFKDINEQWGHATGDRMLLELARRLEAGRREGDTVARLAGDEFVLVLVNLDSDEQCRALIDELLRTLQRPMRIDGQNLSCNASIGVTTYPQADEDVDGEQLLRQADQALYQAKLQGKNRPYFFDAAGDRRLRDRHETLERLKLALEREEFVLFYQPKVNLRTREVIGAEALIRWQHPERGLLPPGAFLDDLLEQPLEVDVSRWVMEQALTQVSAWQASGIHLPVSVNVPAEHLQEPDFFEQIAELLGRFPDLPANSLELEILESSALASLAHVSRVIERCAALGVQFSLDDFGTGYSSLSYLKRIPVQVVKIDRSFVGDMLEDPDDLALLEGIIQLAQVFQRQIIAEGMETPEQGERLRELGCEVVQGYGIARPMPAAEIPQWLAQWQAG